MGVKEGSPRKHTQSVQRPLSPPGPGSQRHFEKSSGFTIKVQKKRLVLRPRKIFHGFCRADGFCMRFPTVWKCCPKKMFLHLIFARVFSFKHFGWLQKTFLLIDLRPCFHFDDLLERCSIHLHLWIESKHRMNESNQWMEAMNRTNESNQRIESMNRITESRDKTRSCDYTHQVTF